LLLTSAGIKNASIQDALVDLLGKPIAESNALCIPTAGYGHPMGSPDGTWRFISGRGTQNPHFDFSIFPHVDHELLPDNTMAAAERWAADIHGPAYAIHDETTISVTDCTVDVVTEGHWKLFSPE
jgi:hypothetical protein